MSSNQEPNNSDPAHWPIQMKVVLWIEVMRIGWPMIRTFLWTGTLSSVALAIFGTLYLTKPQKVYVPQEKIDYVVVPPPHPITTPGMPTHAPADGNPTPATGQSELPDVNKALRDSATPTPTPANLVVHPILRDNQE